MQVPEFLYGDTKTVTAACRKHVAQFRRGQSWVDMGPLIEIDNGTPGLIMLEGPAPMLSGLNARLYAPFRELDNLFVRHRVTFEQCVAACEEAISSAWGVLSLLSPICHNVLEDSGRAERFLTAITRYWLEFEAMGPRYTRGGPYGQELWDVAHFLKVILARRGVAKALLSQPVPPGGIATLLPLKN